MIYHQVKDPVSYQTVFYKQIGLKKHETGDGSGMENDWSSPEIGYIYTFGSMDTMQFGIGEYTVSVDFLSEFQYDTEYLHAGIIYEGVTYSLVDNKMEELAIPSMFLAMEKASGGINCWKKGQHFKGIELSIEMEYLKKEILPFLGISEKALDFLERNVRYLHLPQELQDIILEAERLLKEKAMTTELLKGMSSLFTAHLVRPEIRESFQNGEALLAGKIQVGKKQIRITKEDFRKIVAAHDQIRNNADAFPTIYALSQELKIGEQKLKAGFQKLYQQTIWDYANQIRMSRAAFLLKNTEKTIEEISELTGYQSQAAFRNMFKKWSGTTPGQFRSYMKHNGSESAKITKRLLNAAGDDGLLE